MPMILTGNDDIWELLCLASTQVKVGTKGIIGLDYAVVIEMAKAMDIWIDKLFFRKLQAFEKVTFDLGKDNG